MNISILSLLNKFIKYAGHIGQYRQFVSGEYWIDKYGQSEFADINLGDIGHEGIAFRNLVDKDKLINLLEEYYLKNPEIYDEGDIERLDEYRNEDEDAASLEANIDIPDEVWLALFDNDSEKAAMVKDDVRMAYAKYENATLVIDDNFFVYELNRKNLDNIIDFIYENTNDDDLGNCSETVSIEQANPKKYNEIPIKYLIDMKYPEQVWNY